MLINRIAIVKDFIILFFFRLHYKSYKDLIFKDTIR